MPNLRTIRGMIKKTTGDAKKRDLPELLLKELMLICSLAFVLLVYIK